MFIMRRFLLFIGYFVLGAIWLAGCSSPATSLPVLSSVPPRPTFDPSVIRLANGNWAPYNGSDLPYAGCDSQVIAEAFALENLRVEYDFFPWARSYSLSATGKRDGTLSWADTPEHRTQHYLSAEATTIQEWTFFYRADHPLIWKTLDDLAGKTMGVTTGYVYSDAFKDLRTKGTVNFVESSSDESNFRMLLAGRIDVFPMERKVGYYLIRSVFTPQEQAQLLGSPQPFAQFRTYLFLSKAVPQNEQRIILFDRGFKNLQTSGRYTEIMQNCAP
jgi:polar amino acid transport system substrate-binding protein